VTAAAFVAALVLLPLHRGIHAAVARVLDRDRVVPLAGMQRFVQQVRDRQVPPEQVERPLRESLDDPGLRLLLREPGSGRLVDLAGEPAAVDPGPAAIPLTSGESDVGVIVLSRSSARRNRRAREAAVQARLPIEVSRLRVQLRQAVDDVRSSRARLVEATADERRRLERSSRCSWRAPATATGGSWPCWPT
jgi:hypothetical protein